MESVQKENIFVEWFFWQFYETPKFLFFVWKNYILFSENLFSIPFLLKTLFAPWRRYKWKYPKRFDIVEFFNTLISNTFSRFLGALVRIFLIIIGFIFQVFVIFAGLIIFIGWLLIPFIIIFGFIFFLIF